MSIDPKTKQASIESAVFIRYRGAEIKIAAELMRDEAFPTSTMAMGFLEERLKALGEGCDYSYSEQKGDH